MEMNKKKDIQTKFHKEAEKAAKIVCGMCSSKYMCRYKAQNQEHENQPGDSSCPIEKYHGTVCHGNITQDDLFAICACCEHSGDISRTDNGNYDTYHVERTEDNILDYCLNCPVYELEGILYKEKAEEKTMDELKMDIRQLLGLSISDEYAETIMECIGTYIVDDVIECSSYIEKSGLYTEDDIRMAIGRVLLNRLK